MYACYQVTLPWWPAVSGVFPGGENGRLGTIVYHRSVPSFGRLETGVVRRFN